MAASVAMGLAKAFPLRVDQVGGDGQQGETGPRGPHPRRLGGVPGGSGVVSRAKDGERPLIDQAVAGALFTAIFVQRQLRNAGRLLRAGRPGVAGGGRDRRPGASGNQTPNHCFLHLTLFSSSCLSPGPDTDRLPRRGWQTNRWLITTLSIRFVSVP